MKNSNRGLKMTQNLLATGLVATGVIAASFLGLSALSGCDDGGVGTAKAGKVTGQDIPPPAAGGPAAAPGAGDRGGDAPPAASPEAPRGKSIKDRKIQPQ